ncbi:glycosyltransferase [Porphyromonas sp.]
MRYSFVIPVYNRPEEVRELLESLTRQDFFDFEVVIIEDGSSVSSQAVVDSYQGSLPMIRYIAVSNGGPSRARNIGAREAQGEYLIILDSDVVLPAGYLSAVDDYLQKDPVDAFGGPDAASEDFTPIQKAINYAMTSPLTTGGIRGGSANGMEKFKPRSFNLGCRSSVYRLLGGFNETLRFGEDIDFSLRLIEGGYRTALIPKAFVYHKRRVDFRKFFKQVHNSGIARIHLETRHPGSTRLVHLLPALFTIASAISLFFHIGQCWLIILALILFGDAYARAGRSVEVALLAVPACFIQLWGYGSGFLRAWWGKYILRRREFIAFKDNFYE